MLRPHSEMQESQGVSIETVRNAVAAGRWALTRHAREQAGRRFMETRMLIDALAGGQVLESYPNDPRGASALLLGYTEGQPLHAVCAFDPSGALLVYHGVPAGAPLVGR